MTFSKKTGSRSGLPLLERNAGTKTNCSSQGIEKSENEDCCGSVRSGNVQMCFNVALCSCVFVKAWSAHREQTCGANRCCGTEQVAQMCLLLRCCTRDHGHHTRAHVRTHHRHAQQHKSVHPHWSHPCKSTNRAQQTTEALSAPWQHQASTRFTNTHTHTHHACTCTT